MAWFAVRTKPGAQLPQREYTVEPGTLTKSGRPRAGSKGYRIVPSLNPDISAVERVLKDGGFRFYMPVERRLVRDRRKAGIAYGRRFPLVLGYVFVEDPQDWPALCELPGVAGVVADSRGPLRVQEKDMDLLRKMEGEAEIGFQKAKARLEEADRKRREMLTRRGVRNVFPKGSPVRVTKGVAIGQEGRVVGQSRDSRLKVMVDGWERAGIITLASADLQLVA